MITLDEVINKIESAWACPSSDEGSEYCDLMEVRDDILQYLKWYKDLADDSEAYVEWKENPPLTWDELKSMEGKPVWVEMDGYKPNWGIVMNQDKRNGRLMLCGYDEVAIRIEINEEGEGTVWQAYRKERHAIAG